MVLVRYYKYRYVLIRNRFLHCFLPHTTLFLLLLTFPSFYNNSIQIILKMSSLLELDLSFTASALVATLSLGTKWRSNVWAHCRQLTIDENQDLLYCSHCLVGSTPPPYSTSVSQNMKKHLKGRHKITVERALSKNQVAVNKQLRQLYQQAEANDKRDEFDTKILEACLNTSVITKALITLIVVRNLSFALVEWPEFHT